jgi:inositol 1,4,5-triphosphate receptor-associated cGMP kinase
VLAKLPQAEDEKRFPGKAISKLAKAPGLKDFQIQVQPVRMQKLTKLREVGSCGQLGRVSLGCRPLD